MQTVILAGGLGTRLRPLTEKIPKAMIPIQGRPFLEYLIQDLVRQGMREILLCVGYLWQRIEDYFKDGSRLGCQIHYSIESSPLGTGGAMKQAARLIGGDFLLVNGDTYLPFALQTFLEQAEKDTAPLGILVVSEQSSVSNLCLDSGGWVTHYQKNAVSAMTHADAGMAYYRKEVLEFLPQLPDQFSWEESLYPKLIEQHRLRGYSIQVPFFDIGAMERLDQIQQIGLPR